MIIGNGLMAKTFEAFKTHKKVLIFASGVSDSTHNNFQNFLREATLLKSTIEKHPNFQLVYFSTCSVTDASVNNNAYVLHKLEMESIIKKMSKNYLICRISNVVGPTGNPHTIVPFLIDAIQEQKEIDVWKYAERNLIDCEDVLWMVSKLIDKGVKNKIVNIASRENIRVVDLISLIESHYQKQGIYRFIEKGNPLHIDVSYINDLLEALALKKGTGILYIKGLLNKYYRS